MSSRARIMPARGVFERRLRVGFIFVILSIAALTAGAWQTIAWLIESSRRVSHTHEVIAAIERMKADMELAETSQRWALLTNHGEDWADYNRSKSDTFDDLSKLSGLTSDNARQRSRLGEFLPLLRRRFAISDQVLASARKFGLPSAIRLIRRSESRRVVGEALSSLDALQAEEERLLGERAVRENERSGRALTSVIGFGAAVMLIAIIGIWTILRDLRLRAALERELENFFELSQDMLVIIGAEGYCARLSRSWEKTLGWSFGETTGRRYMEFVHPDDRAKTEAAAARILEGANGAEFENRCRCKDGSYKTLSWSVVAFEGKFYAAARDMSARKALEQERQETLQVKMDFINMASHELRTPLTAIKVSVDILEGQAVGTLTEGQKHFAGLAKRNIDRLVRLINDVLDFQKMDVGRLEFRIKNQDISPVLREAASTFAPVAAAKGLRLDLRIAEKTVVVPHDKDRIAQVVANFLLNAIKFSNKGVVTLSGRLSNGSFEVGVSDEGPGIRREDIDKLFKGFTQLDAGRNAGGTGLGLALAKRIIDSHDGRVGVKSELGRGANFYFSLPLKPGDAN